MPTRIALTTLALVGCTLIGAAQSPRQVSLVVTGGTVVFANQFTPPS